MRRRSRQADITDRKPAPALDSLRILVVGAGVSGIAIARGLRRDGHDVTVFEQRPEVTAGGGAVTIWSNGATVLEQLGVEMDGAGQVMSTVRIATSKRRPLATIDVSAIADRLRAPTRMVPRRILLERLMNGFPADRIHCHSRVVTVENTNIGVRVELADGSSVEGDVLVGEDGLHSTVRDIVGGRRAEPTGWCSWQGLATGVDVADKEVALQVVGEHGNLGLWPAGGSSLQWWFDLRWSSQFVRPASPIALLRSSFGGWSDLADRVLASLTDDDLGPSPYPHFRHSIPRLASPHAITLLGDAAHTMPPFLAQGTNQALLDAMVLRKAISDVRSGVTRSTDLPSALRWYENTRRRRVGAVSWVASLEASQRDSVLRPAALISDRFTTSATTMFLRSLSHPRMSAQISRDLGARVSTSTPAKC